MDKIKTEAWILHKGEKNEDSVSLFRKGIFSFDPISEEEILVEPIFGGWEANMTHALMRIPLDVCRKRGESKVVLGNSGVVRVIDTGSKVTQIKKGDICIFFANASCNRWGYLDTHFASGYDVPGSIGMLARQCKVVENQLIPIPKNSKLPLRLWPIISIRYGTAWSNWKVTLKCWRALLSKEKYPSPYVFGWGGGVALGELTLAKEQGFKVAMIASNDERLEFIKNLDITPIDRRVFPELNYDPKKYDSDRNYRKKYFASFKIFRDIVNEITEGEGVSIFIENIGLPVYPATLRVLGRPGVITTSGWKEGMNIDINRAMECFSRHNHIFTHAFTFFEAKECISYAIENKWIPQDSSPIYDWEDIPQLAHDFSNGKINSYFPTYRVNPI